VRRFYCHRSIADFILENEGILLSELVNRHEFAVEEQQRIAWNEEIRLLKRWLQGMDGDIVLEYSIPRMGKRIDCVILCGGVVFAIEFKVGADCYASHAIDQVMDYALDLKNFHSESHSRPIMPVLLCTRAEKEFLAIEFQEDGVANVVLSNGSGLAEIISKACSIMTGASDDATSWLDSGYKPTPTIIEAAQALYRGHGVDEISNSDSGRINLSKTAKAIESIIEASKRNHQKSICFLTGVPGAGKTLAGLNLANSWHNSDESEHAVFLSGNGPLVQVLCEALARDEVANARENGERLKKGAVLSQAKAFIQNIHHFRDEALKDARAPLERVVIFDEAQRAWTLKQTASFMKTKKNIAGFAMSEPEFLIRYMDRHPDWATIVCLIGGGQEINTGEAGLHEWFDSLKRSFPGWEVYASRNLSDSEYTQGRDLFEGIRTRLRFENDLHLSVSIRSFRSEKVAAFVKAVLDCDSATAKLLYKQIAKAYPIVLTRKLDRAKLWLRTQARGTERFGLLASSGAMRLKPCGIHVKCAIEPKNWFLNGKDDIRSSYFLEDVATEFDVQGLELDWTCVAWDADFRHDGRHWMLRNFSGTKWTEVNEPYSQIYLKNAYRVLLTRARQGMVIFVPHGSEKDGTRLTAFYNGTYNYLRSIGIVELEN
jgi:hypothetical protein